MPVNQPTDAGFMVEIPVDQLTFDAGTSASWNVNHTGGIANILKNATAQTTSIFLSFSTPRLEAQYGMKLKSITIPVNLGTTGLSTAAVFTLYTNNLSRAGTTTITSTTVAQTASGTGTASTTLDYAFVFTVDSQAFENTTGTVSTANYLAELKLACFAGTILKVFNPTVKFNVS